MPRREMRAGGMADTQRPVTSPNTAEVTIRGQKLDRLPRDKVRVRSYVRTTYTESRNRHGAAAVMPTVMVTRGCDHT